MRYVVVLGTEDAEPARKAYFDPPPTCDEDLEPWSTTDLDVATKAARYLRDEYNRDAFVKKLVTVSAYPKKW